MTESETIKDFLLNERKESEKQAKEVIKALNGFSSIDKHSGKDLKTYHELNMKAVDLIAKLQLIDSELKK